MLRKLCFAVLALLMLPLASARADVGIGIGIGAPVYRPYYYRSYRPYYRRVYYWPYGWVYVRPAPVVVAPQLLELYRNYLTLLARMQIGRRLQGKVDAADLVQETFLAAHRDFAQFRGTTEAELVSWLRRILAGNLIDLLRRYCGAQRRDVRLERQLVDEVDESSRALGLVLPAKHSSPSPVRVSSSAPQPAIPDLTQRSTTQTP
jgi:hypothetical protein